MENGQQAATKQDVVEAVRASEDRLVETMRDMQTASEDRVVKTMRDMQTASEDRLLKTMRDTEDRVVETMRDMQTEILKGFYSFAESNRQRVAQLEGN